MQPFKTGGFPDLEHFRQYWEALFSGPRTYNFTDERFPAYTQHANKLTWGETMGLSIRALRSLALAKAPGPYEVYPEHLRAAEQVSALAIAVAHWRLARRPAVHWPHYDALLRLIPKDDTYCASAWRPLTLLPCGWRVIMAMCAERLKPHLAPTLPPTPLDADPEWACSMSSWQQVCYLPEDTHTSCPPTP
jgi:hypothetical protein